jgi:hypothetical protein
VESTTAPARDVLVFAPLDDGDVDAGQRQFASEHQPSWAASHDHHRVFGHHDPPGSQSVRYETARN